MARPVLSLVVPVRDEEGALTDLNTRILDLLSKVTQDAEVIFVNDGSKDLSGQVLRGLAVAEPRYRVLSLSRAFGPAAAIAAGLRYARGQAVLTAPPEVIERSDLVFEMAQKWRDGYDIVNLRARPRRGGLGGLVRKVAQAMLPADAPLEEGAARLMSRRTVVAMRALGESHRFVRGVVAWIGFRQTEIEYDPEGFAPKLGATWRAAWAALTAFSTAPLRLAIYFGLILGGFALFLGVVSAIVVATGSTLPGWFAGAIIAALLTSGELVAIGVLGDYVGKIYDEVKRRPLYVVSERVNLAAPDDDAVDENAPAPMFELAAAHAQKPAQAAQPAQAQAPIPTMMGIAAPNVTAQMHAAVPKTAPMPQFPAPGNAGATQETAPPVFPPLDLPSALVFPSSGEVAAAAAASSGAIPDAEPSSGAFGAPASIKTAQVATVKMKEPSGGIPTASIPTVKPGTLEAPTIPQPSVEAPTIRQRDAATLESPASPPPRSTPPSRSSSPPPLPSAKRPPPPVPPRRTKKDE